MRASGGTLVEVHRCLWWPIGPRLGTLDDGVLGRWHVLDDRKLAVLRAIVHDYVSTMEPVGSKSLVDRHRLDVSPATIRNDMAVLEEQGYISQPHTSAADSPPTRDTGCSSTACPGSSRCRRPSGGRSRPSWPVPTTPTTW